MKKRPGGLFLRYSLLIEAIVLLRVDLDLSLSQVFAEHLDIVLVQGEFDLVQAVFRVETAPVGPVVVDGQMVDLVILNILALEHQLGQTLADRLGDVSLEFQWVKDVKVVKFRFWLEVAVDKVDLAVFVFFQKAGRVLYNVTELLTSQFDADQLVGIWVVQKNVPHGYRLAKTLGHVIHHSRG